MVEGTTLERWHTRKGIEGSNPSLSAEQTPKERERDSNSVSGNPTRATRIRLKIDGGSVPAYAVFSRLTLWLPGVLMLISRPPDIPISEITDEALYWNRREFL